MPLTKTACACASAASCPHPIQDIVAEKSIEMEHSVDYLLSSFSRRALLSFMSTDVVGVSNLDEEAAMKDADNFTKIGQRKRAKERPKSAGATQSHSNRKNGSGANNNKEEKLARIRPIPDDSHLLKPLDGRPDVTSFSPADRIIKDYSVNPNSAAMQRQANYR